jgi:hypothetical protein
MLLRRLGPDLRRVVAAWELTPVEQAALATRVPPARGRRDRGQIRGASRNVQATI